MCGEIYLLLSALVSGVVRAGGPQVKIPQKGVKTAEHSCTEPHKEYPPPSGGEKNVVLRPLLST